MKNLGNIFEIRKISEKTLEENNVVNKHKKIQSKDMYMYEGSPYEDGPNVIKINYNPDNPISKLSGEQYINIDTLKQTMHPKNKKDLIFNYENIKDEDHIILCFDFIDYLTLYEMGYRNICSKSNKGNGFVNKYYDQLKKHKSITLAFGNIISSDTLDNILSRLGNETIKIARINEYKTVNHAYLSEKQSLIKDSISDAEYIEIEEIRRLEDITFEEASQDELRFGSKGGAFSGIDWRLDGIRDGMLTVIFGPNNNGKTSVVQQIMNNVIEQEKGVFLYDGESNPASLKRKLYLKLIGDVEGTTEKRKINIRPIRYPKKSVEDAIQKWHEDKLIIKSVGNNESIFSNMEVAYKRHNCKVYVIDNLMSLLVTNSRDKYTDQANIVEKLKQFAKAYHVHVILIAHPHKVEENVSMTKMNISGAGEISDKADAIISVMRWFKDKYDKFDGKQLDQEVDTIIDILKNREFGELGRFLFKFDKNTERFVEIVDKDNYKEYRDNKYTWQKYLSDSVDRNTYEYIEVDSEKFVDSPF